MTRPNLAAPDERLSLSTHILPNSATMVGVCLTAIMLVKLLEATRGPSMVDESLAVDSAVFCLSALLSYASIRWSNKRRAKRYERIADYLFLAGMLAMTVICIVFAFDVG